MAAKKTDNDNEGNSPENKTKMTPEQLDEAVKKANFSIQEKPENPDETQPAMMFDADTKVTPALVMKRLKEEEAKRKKSKEQPAPNSTGMKIETRAGGRRVIRHN